jgi:uncharacterized protein
VGVSLGKRMNRTGGRGRTPRGRGGLSDEGGREQVWGVVLPAMFLPFLAAFCYFVLLEERLGAQLVYGGAKLFILVWPVAAYVWILRRGWPRLRVRQWKAHLGAVPLGLATGLGISLVILLSAFGPGREILLGGREAIEAKSRSLGVMEHYWAFGLFLAVGHSLLEEYYWRWFVFGRLRELLRGWRAHALTAVAFSAHHVVITTQFFSFEWGLVFGLLTGAGGWIWSWMYERQGTLTGAWVSHMLVDFAILGVGHWLLFGWG